ncbi:hypothetical protein D4A35_01775 [Paraclostridium bifermentans]|uniref:Uncharacterized protein n=1 Tax=Paraclostridium bifermentans TaxID=1490 RepID=A0A5P3XEI1_PARBF|nr:hypothetical protein [Paraclostridium bifermentans]QEZ67721.1 hypothetical protein D4A35_01775 [Paraclostridium bifermentans]
MSDEKYEKLISNKIKLYIQHAQINECNITEFNKEQEIIQEEINRLQLRYEYYENAKKQEIAKLKSNQDKKEQLERICYDAKFINENDIK